MWLGLAMLVLLSYVPALSRAALACAVGMRVARVMVGFGPPVAAWTMGRTRWQLHAVPVGAFSQIRGLDATDSPVDPAAPDSFGGRSRLAQLLVLLGGVVGFVGLAIALTFGGNLAFGIREPDPSVVLIDSVSPGHPAAAAGLLAEDQIVAAAGVPIDRVEALAPALAATRGAVELTIRRDGVERTLMATPETVGDNRRLGVTLLTGVRVRRVGPGGAIADALSYPFGFMRYIVAGIPQTLRERGRQSSGVAGLVRTAGRSQSGGPRAMLGVMAALAVYFALWLLVPLPANDGGRVLAWIFGRRRSSQTAAIDAGVHPSTKLRASWPWFALLACVGVGSMATVGAGFVVLAGLVRRRAWAWGATRAVAGYLAGSELLNALVHRRGLDLAGAAIFTVIGLLSGATAVRLLLGLRCPVCSAVAGEPVLGARQALSCRACGSTWTRADHQAP